MHRLPAIEWLDQRLQDRHGAVVRTRISPRFEKMRGGHMPVTNLRSFVFVLAEVNAHHLLVLVEAFESQLEICRSVVDGIAAENYQLFNYARIDIFD